MSPSSSGLGSKRARVGQRLQAREPEQLLEQLGAPVHHRTEARAPGLLDQPPLEQRPDRRLRRHTADARHLGPRHGLEIGHDRQAFGLSLREWRRARARQQAAGRPLRNRVGREREATGHLAQDHAAVALGVVLAQACERLDDLALAHLAGVGQPVDRHGLGREEEQRLDGPCKIVHDDTTVIGPKGTSCSHLASPAL